MSKLETKIARQVKIEKVLKLIVLFSLTQSGFKKDDLEHLRKMIGWNYSHSEVATLCNLQTAGLVRLRDKEFNWPEIKEVIYPIFLLIYFVEIQTHGDQY
jgi:hypothetical protein